MDKRSISNRIFRLFRFVYLKLFRINDTPQKIAIGLGVGVFFGVMPAMGPFIALTFAFILRVNRAAAFLGSLLTNTWLSIPTFLIAVKAGSLVTGADYDHVRQGCRALLTNFKWSKLFEVSIYDILLPTLLGYVIVSLVIGFFVYLVSLIILNQRKGRGAMRPS